MEFLEKNDKKIEILLFTLFPFFLFNSSSGIFVDFEKEPILKIALGLFLGGMGAGIGFGFYWFSKTKSLIFKIGAGVLLLLICIGFVRTAVWYQKNSIETCEICGYKSVKDNVCAICGTATWKIEKRNNDYPSKTKWIYENQVFWFANSEFYEPKVKDGFVKDKMWKPSFVKKVTNSDKQ